MLNSVNAVNLAEKVAKISEHGSPRVVAEMNDYQLKLVKFRGEFVWHDHKDTDEVFLDGRERPVYSKGKR